MAKTLTEVNTDAALGLSVEIEKMTTKFNGFLNSLNSEDRQYHLEQISSIKRNSRLLYDQAIDDMKQERGKLVESKPSTTSTSTSTAITQPKPEEDEEVKKKEPNIFEKIATVATGGAVIAGGIFGEPTPPGEVVGTGQYAQKDAYIGPTGDTDGQQTGLDMNLAGGIGAPIYAPIDLIYVNTGTDGNPSVGLDGTPDVRGPSGRGFGYYAAYRFIKNGKQYEVLMGHFASMAYRGTNNQIISKGTLLGSQGASGRTVGAGGKPYPHISLHINGIGFTATNADLILFANLLAGKQSTVQPSPRKPKPITPSTANKPNPMVSTTQQKLQPQVASSSSPGMLNSSSGGASSGITREQLQFATV